MGTEFVQFIGKDEPTNDTEKRLQRVIDQNLALLQSVSEGIYGIDPEGRTIFWNAAAERMTGFTAAEMLGSDNHDPVHRNWANGTEQQHANCPIFYVLGTKTPERLPVRCSGGKTALPSRLNILSTRSSIHLMAVLPVSSSPFAI